MILPANPSIAEPLCWDDKDPAAWALTCHAYAYAIDRAKDLIGSGRWLGNSWTAMMTDEDQYAAILRNWVCVEGQRRFGGGVDIEAHFENWLHACVIRDFSETYLDNLTDGYDTDCSTLAHVIALVRDFDEIIKDGLEGDESNCIFEALVSPLQEDIIDFPAWDVYTLECGNPVFYLPQARPPEALLNASTRPSRSNIDRAAELIAWIKERNPAEPVECEAEPIAFTQSPRINHVAKSGFIYAIKSSAAIKIGLTTGKPESRLKALQTSHHEKLVLIKAVQAADTTEAERSIHSRFQDKRLSGEWFRITEQEAIEALGQIA